MRALAGRRGVRIGVDVGRVRIGVAASDPDGLLASPVMTLRHDPRTMSDLDELAALVRDRQAVEVVVGLPRTLAGREGLAVRMARTYADAVAQRVAPVPVRLVDERLTTVSAERVLGERGLRGRACRAVVDQEAAVQILQADLDALRAAGGPGGRAADGHPPGAHPPGAAPGPGPAEPA